MKKKERKKKQRDTEFLATGTMKEFRWGCIYLFEGRESCLNVFRIERVSAMSMTLNVFQTGEDRVDEFPIAVSGGFHPVNELLSTRV